MVEIQTIIKNESGIHCRPSSEILLKRQNFSNCELTISTIKGDADLNSILSLISLGLSKGDSVTIRANGEDENCACTTIAKLFACHFDFPPQK